MVPRFKLLFLPTVLLVALVFLILFKNTRTHLPHNLTGCEDNQSPVFTVAPTDLSNITLLSPPIMKVGSGIKSHSYIETSGPSPVYAPIDSVLVTGAKYSEDYVDSSKVQYTLLFQVSCNVSYYYDHLVDVVPEIAQEFPDPPQINDSSSDMRMSVPVKAGDLLGYSWSRQFDFGVLDSNTAPALISFEGYRYSEKAYAVCPLTFFAPDVKRELEEKVGYFDAADLTVIDNLCD